MQADQMARVGHCGTQQFERQAGGVGGQYRAGAQLRFGHRIQCPLGLQILEDRFYDDVGLGHTRAFDIRAQPLARGAALRRRRQPLGEQAVRARQRGLDQFQLPVLERDVQTAQRAPRGDVPTHDAGANHVHTFDRSRALARQRLEPIL